MIAPPASRRCGTRSHDVGDGGSGCWTVKRGCSSRRLGGREPMNWQPFAALPL